MLPGISAIVMLFSLVAQTGIADRTRAQHAHDDQVWAQKSGLAVSEVRAIRIAAGILDDTLGSLMLNLDVISLKQRNQILLVDGLCVRIHVMEYRGDAYAEVWSLSQEPGFAWSVGVAPKRPSRGICSQAPERARAYATTDGRIVLEVPKLLDPFERPTPVSTYTFAWDGKQYQLTGEER